MTAPAAVSWAARLSWMPLQDTGRFEILKQVRALGTPALLVTRLGVD